jgi:hypothetical protein
VPPVPDLADPHWFPVDLHVPERWFGMLELSEDAIERSSFLDNRIEARLEQAVALPVLQVGHGRPRSTLGWLFHTSFCASTLLARALHLAPFTVCLKEPLVLRRLSDAKHKQWSLDGLLEPAVQLLARPWQPGGAVVIKPTHVALNLAGALLKATPGSRAVILTCTLDEFLISNLKKPADSQAKIPTLIERALRATTFGARLAPAAHRPPDLVSAAGLQWAAQRELMLDVIQGAQSQRVRALDMQTLLADLPGTAVRCAGWLQLPLPSEPLIAHASAAGTRNAKATAVPYGAERQRLEAEIVVAHHREALARGRAWLETHVLPVMRPQARAEPAAWS